MSAALGEKVATPVERADTGAGMGDEAERPYAQDRQEVRVAVVMIGGVSLAIWIGGVTLELQHLHLAGRHLDRSAVPLRVYQELLDFLHARARVDVIAGTSAGGVNGGFLALGVVH
jgi:predicted acylesterase/phospholipase RssA